MDPFLRSINGKYWGDFARWIHTCREAVFAMRLLTVNAGPYPPEASCSLIDRVRAFNAQRSRQTLVLRLDVLRPAL